MSGNPGLREESSARREAKKPRIILPCHPFLFALFPVLSLYSRNLGDARAGEVGAAAALMGALAGVGLVVLRVPFGSWRKAAVALSLLWLPFYGYGLALGLLRGALGKGLGAGSVAVLGGLGLVAVAWTAVLLLVWRTRRDMNPATRLLNSFALFAVAVPLVWTGMGLARQERLSGGPPPVRLAGTDSAVGRAQVPSPRETAELPDIYYIVPDSYPRADYLLEAFGYDNSPFLDALRARGFYVAEKSRSNYPRTQMSLACSMNLAYLDQKLVEEEWSKNLPIFVRQLWDNRLMDFLAAQGYELPAFSSGVAATEMRNEGSRFVKPRTLLLTEFQQRFFEQTPLRVVLSRLWKNTHANRILYVLEELSRIRRGTRPMFVFVHFMSPHIPHQFDAECVPCAETPGYFEGYVGETECLNRQFLALIDGILARQPNSVFLIQGDHGPHTDWRDMSTTDTLPWEGTWEQWVRDNTAILNAYYFPDRDYSALYPEITPVNSFRILLDRYFGTEYGTLPDTSYIDEIDGAGIREVTEVY